MNKLTNEEIAKVFAMYWGCEIIGTESNTVVTNTWFDDVAKILMAKGKVKLLLIPLSSISDEHKLLLLKIHGYTDIDKFELQSNLTQFDHVFRVSFKTDNMPNNVWQQLVHWGYDVPIHFGFNHWANGKTAIELGIAIEKNK